ncbi:MAG: type VI secretion system baseplate subunit TssG [Alphaproteobacteria bacterium]|nr:MAG: type VI secretion system baseplate subunit TssG [Alphaproteobacteria bacterium]
MNLHNRLTKYPWKFSLNQFVFLTIQNNATDESQTIFECNNTLSVTSSDVISVKNIKNTNHVTVNSVSLTGIQGPLPIYYFDLIAERNQNNDFALFDFFNMFNNRVVLNVFNITKKSTPCLENTKLINTTLGYIINSIGLGEVTNYFPLLKQISTYFPILFWSQRSPQNLIYILESFIPGSKIKCNQFVGQWLKINPDSQTTLRTKCNKSGLQLLGKRFWHINNGIELIITLKSIQTYKQILPNQPLRKELELIIKAYMPYNIKFHIKLKLDYEKQPKLYLTKESAVLSYLNWLNTSDECSALSK